MQKDFPDEDLVKEINIYLYEAKLDNDFLTTKKKLSKVESELSEKTKTLRQAEGDLSSLKRQIEVKNKIM